MNTTLNQISSLENREAIDEYFECTTYCSLTEKEQDCKTICMERHLKGNYF